MKARYALGAAGVLLLCGLSAHAQGRERMAPRAGAHAHAVPNLGSGGGRVPPDGRAAPLLPARAPPPAAPPSPTSQRTMAASGGAAAVAQRSRSQGPVGWAAVRPLVSDRAAPVYRPGKSGHAAINATLGGPATFDARKLVRR
jgi:hypothetical protein